jgi:hypothetical protein
VKQIIIRTAAAGGPDLPDAGPAFMTDMRRGCSPMRTLRPHLWFSDLPSERNEAIRICKQVCPFTAECDTWAEANDERWGVWGGVVRSLPAPAEAAAPAQRPVNSNPNLFAEMSEDQRAAAVRGALADGRTIVQLARFWKVEMGYLQRLAGLPVIDDEIIRLYHADKSNAEIAVAVGVSPTKVARVLHQHHLPSKYTGHGKRKTENIDGRVLELWRDELSDQKIAETLGCARSVVAASRARQKLPTLYGAGGKRKTAVPA